MKYRDLRDFAAQLERSGQLRRVDEPISPVLEMTALSDQVLRAGGPALWFERPTGFAVGAGQSVRHAAPGGVGHGR